MKRNGSLLGILFFLLNAVQFNIVDDNAGGGSDDNDNNDNGGSGDNDSGNQGDNDSGNSDDDSNDNDVSKLPEFAQKMIKTLRGEAAANRTKNKSSEDRLTKLENGLKSALGLGDDDQATPEQQIQDLTAQSQDFAARNAVLEVAIEEGLSRDQSDYFGYLLQKEGDSLEDGQELTEERYAELIKLAKGTGASGESANSSVDDDGTPDNSGNAGTITPEQFGLMSYGEKVALRQKDEALYNKLFNEARSKKLIK